MVEHRHGSRSLRLRWLVAVAIVWSMAAGVAGAAHRPYGDARVLAQVPTPPGFPEGVAVSGNLVCLRPGHLRDRRRAAVQGARVPRRHRHARALVRHPGRGPVTGARQLLHRRRPPDAGLRAQHPARVVRISLNGKQEQYSTPFPDLPARGQVAEGAPCSLTPFDAPPLPNDLVFDSKANLYVTDSTPATIWRVPAGGGEPQICFQDPRLASPSIGPNGIRIGPGGTTLYFTVSEDLQGGSFVYTLPLVADPSAEDLEVLHECTGGDLPDGIAFGRSGRLYVAIVTPFASGISVLSPEGDEVARLGNEGNPLLPYDSPANIAFDGKGSILVTNHAFVTGVTDPGQFTVLDVYVADTGHPLNRPVIL